jgi:O-antigen/teichoic acid export membrane protein
MLSSRSVSTRFLFSVGANGLRALVSLLAGLVLARNLSPAGYGNVTYLLASFVAIRALVDMGSSSAFYTFIARSDRGRRFYLLYFAWLALQFVGTLALVALVLPRSVLDDIWFGHSRGMIVLALVASFLQQQIWTTITQLGEAARRTVIVQSLSLAVVSLHLALVVTLQALGFLSVRTVLIAIACEYALAVPVAAALLKRATDHAPVTEPATRAILGEYWRFCRPLMVIAVAAFLYEFADKWLLQRFAGAQQQGYYQIAAQLAAVSLLAATSILNILWKEIAEASARGDAARLKFLYTRVNRGLFVLGATVSCFLIPWSRELVALLLGPEYQESWPVLALMLLYPIHQSMGQVNTTVFMASDRTRSYMRVALAGQIVSLPVAYFALAPASGVLVPGLALGAYGLALKMVVMNVLLVNLQAWIVARFQHWRYEWGYQVAGIALLLGLGVLVKAIAVALVPGALVAELAWPFIVGVIVAGILYLAGVACVLYAWPSLAGVDREGLRVMLARLAPARS